VELVLYRVAQESLTNVVRHANAGHVTLVLRRDGDGVELRIRDDGRGMAGSGEGAGISGMRERALLIGAALTVTAPAEGGTEVSLRVATADGGR
jgi:two-component system sensor histidine kinase UhpB